MSHRNFGSKHITVYLNNQPVQIHGTSLMARALTIKLRNANKGCVASNVLKMVSGAIYFDRIKKELVSDDDFIGMYDIEKIRNKIDQIWLKDAIYDLKKTNKTYSDLYTDEAQIEDISKNIIQQKTNEKYPNLIKDLSLIGDKYEFSYIYHPNSPVSYSVLSLGLYVFERVNPFSLNQLKKEFRECHSDQFFFIPLTTIPFYPLDQAIVHANGILINKAKGTVFRIEPKFFKEEVEKNKKINEGIIHFVEELGMSSPNLIEINVTCPQTIVNDQNCIFWSLLIFEELLKNLYKFKDPNQTIQEISSKPKNELENLIYKFKFEMFSKLLPELLNKSGLKCPEFQQNQNKYLTEISNEYSKITGGPMLGEPPKLGGKTRRSKKSKRTKKSKNRLAH